MTENEKIIKRHKELDLYNQSIITRCVKILKPIDMKEIEQTIKDIYTLSEQRALLLICVINALEIYNNTKYVINDEEKIRLFNFMQTGSYLCKD